MVSYGFIMMCLCTTAKHSLWYRLRKEIKDLPQYAQRLVDLERERRSDPDNFEIRRLSDLYDYDSDDEEGQGVQCQQS